MTPRERILSAVNHIEPDKLPVDSGGTATSTITRGVYHREEDFSSISAWILEYLGEYADYVGFHRYVGNYEDNIEDFLAVTNSIDRQIEDMDSVCRFIQAKRRSTKWVYLCFDEWNVCYKNQEKYGSGMHAPHLLEERYNQEDALVVAGFLLSFIRHADVLKIANIAQLPALSFAAIELQVE